MRRQILKFLSVLLVTCSWVGHSHLELRGQEANAEPMVLKSYDVVDLLASDFVPQMGGMPGTDMFQRESEGSTMRGGYGMPAGGYGGGFGGGGSGGGGLFAVPPQMGGSDGGMGGQGGGMPPMMMPATSNGSEGSLGNEGRRLVDLLQAMVAPSTWEDMGGQGNCHYFGGSILVNQSEANHAKIEQVLKLLREAKRSTRVVQLEWVAVKAQPADVPLLSKLTDQELDQKLETLWAQRGCATTLNGRLVFTTAAEHRNIVISVTPVVGGFTDDSINYGNQVGYQPKAVRSAIGWVVQMRPVIAPGEGGIGRIQVGANYTAAPPKTAELGPGQLDTVLMKSFQVAGLVQASENKWALVGGMAPAADPNIVGGNGELVEQFYIFVRWTEPKVTAEESVSE